MRELVESSSLENCRTLTGTVGSNPTLTATFSPVELFRHHQPYVRLLNLRVPVMGGVEAIGTIRSTFPAARFVVSTTYGGSELAAQVRLEQP